MSRRQSTGINGSVLSQQAFGRELVARVRNERPEMDVRMISPFFLLIEPEPGKARVVPILTLYRSYCADPGDKESLVEDFLAHCVYEAPPVITGDFAHNRLRILPQIIPASLVSFSRHDGQPLAVMPFVGGLFIAFVVDEPERYCYINQDVLARWQVEEKDLLGSALVNLRMASAEVQFHQIGMGAQSMFALENYDGYDASRILLSRLMADVSARVAGQPVIAIPHRDSLFVIGDIDRSFVEAIGASVKRDFEAHSYPITPKLLTVSHGEIVLYEWERGGREVN